MAGYISEFFGYNAADHSIQALSTAAKKVCPFTGNFCTKILARNKTISGVCSIRQKTEGSPNIICCPIRLYAENYKMLHTIAENAFKTKLNLYAGRNSVEKARQKGGAVAVFGKGWGGELRLPQRKGTGSYYVDWVLARLDANGELMELTAIEVQTIDTTGSYGNAQKALAEKREIISDTVGLNWENVSKRIIPQIIYKGQVLQREDLCHSGLYLVCPNPVYQRIVERLGGKEKLPAFPNQPASIHFVSYDTIEHNSPDGHIARLDILEEHCTTVYKVQEAFSSLNLPEGNIYKKAICQSLYPERYKLKKQ